MAEKAECYWLLDYIFSNQILAEIKKQDFQVWKIFVINNSATIKVEDGNYNVVKEFQIPYTDFPFPAFSLYFTNTVLLLKSEY